jgi:hypothetical protein
MPSIKNIRAIKMEKPLVDQVESHVENEISTEFEVLTITKNSWLYPSDSFGNLEKGVVMDSRTYYYEIKTETGEL